MLFTYNSVNLPYPFITDFKSDVVYDEKGNTDWVCTKYDISVQCIINPLYLAIVCPDLLENGVPFTDNPADIMSVIRSRLERPRRELIVSFNGVNLMPQAQVKNGVQIAGTVDARNGPMPQGLSITDLTNGTFLVIYSITANYWENIVVNKEGGFNPIAANDAGANILYNRWTETVVIDELMLSTRTRTGQFAIRSDNAAGLVADKFRSSFAVTGIPKGFTRQSSQYTVDPSGLALEYTIVDREQYKMPPAPAFKAWGEYTETTTNPTGQVRFGTAHVILEGAKTLTSPQGTTAATLFLGVNSLVKAAVATCATKLLVRGLQITKGKGGFNILKQASCTIGLYENKVEFTMTGMLVDDSVNTLFQISNINCQTPFSGDDVKYTPPYLDKGSAGIVLQAAAYYDPSLQSVNLNRTTGQMSQGFEVGQAGINNEP